MHNTVQCALALQSKTSDGSGFLDAFLFEPFYNCECMWPHQVEEV